MKRLLQLLALVGVLAASVNTASAGHNVWGRSYYKPRPQVVYSYSPPLVRPYCPARVIPYGQYTPDYPAYYYGPWATPYGHYSYAPGGVIGGGNY